MRRASTALPVMPRNNSTVMASSNSWLSEYGPPANSTKEEYTNVVGRNDFDHGVPVCCAWYSRVGTHGPKAMAPTAIAPIISSGRRVRVRTNRTTSTSPTDARSQIDQ